MTINVKFDAQAVNKLFASLHTGNLLRDSVAGALLDESTRTLDDAYARQPIVIHGRKRSNTLQMRKNADGVFVLDKKSDA